VPGPLSSGAPNPSPPVGGDKGVTSMNKREPLALGERDERGYVYVVKVD
jgi:hypothetical protein